MFHVEQFFERLFWKLFHVEQFGWSYQGLGNLRIISRGVKRARKEE